jgi:hypoxanthine phosphoribosyltransferase
MVEKSKLYLKWQDIETTCLDVAKQVRGQYDVVVPITRGGLVPGTMIANMLGISNVIPISWQTRDGGNQDTKLLSDIVTNPNHKRILIVDDILDSGRCISEICQLIRAIDINKVITFAVLIKNIAYTHHEDEMIGMIYANRYDKRLDDRWVVFPWEKTILEVA